MRVERVREYSDAITVSANVNHVCSRVHIGWDSRMDVPRGDLGHSEKHYYIWDPEIINEMTKNHIYFYLFKEAKLKCINYKKILISREKVKFTKLFEFVRPKFCTYKYIYIYIYTYMTSIHCYMFRLLTAIIRKPHEQKKTQWTVTHCVALWHLIS